MQLIFSEQFDFIGLAETWLKASKEIQFNAQNYHIINKPRSYTHPQARRGSGGLLLYIHNRIWENIQILDNTYMDDRIWVKLICKQNIEKDIFICFCYLPPKGSTISCNRQSEWSSFEFEIVKFASQGDILVCGDLNARTGTQCDYVENDNDIPEHFSLTYIADQGYRRVSQDPMVNMQGRCLLDLCIGLRLRILNGRQEGDSNGKYTCFTPNGCSVVDYVIASADLQHRISGLSIQPLTQYSDHCPLTGYYRPTMFISREDNQFSEAYKTKPRTLYPEAA